MTISLQHYFTIARFTTVQHLLKILVNKPDSRSNHNLRPCVIQGNIVLSFVLSGWVLGFKQIMVYSCKLTTFLFYVPRKGGGIYAPSTTFWHLSPEVLIRGGSRFCLKIDYNFTERR